MKENKEPGEKSYPAIVSCCYRQLLTAASSPGLLSVTASPPSVGDFDASASVIVARTLHLQQEPVVTLEQAFSRRAQIEFDAFPDVLNN